MKNIDEFNTIISRNLVSNLKFNQLRLFSGQSEPTPEGHGPFCKMTNDSIVYDLRQLKRPIYGHSHPLEIRILALEQTNNLKSPNESDLSTLLKLISKTNPFLENFHISYIDQITELTNYTILNVQDSNFKNSFLQKKDVLIYLSPNIIFNYQDRVENIFQYINENNLEFGIIEDSTIGLSNSDFLYKLFTHLHPTSIVSNFNLPIFCHLSKKQQISKKYDQNKKYEKFNSFLRFYYESNLFFKEGRIDIIHNQINKMIKEYNLSFFSQLGTSIICDIEHFKIDELRASGIIFEYFEDKLVFGLPISILSKHIEEIFQILNKCKV